MVEFLELYLLQTITTFVFILARVSGIVTTAPFYGSLEIPITIRGFLAITLSLLIAPTQWGHFATPTNNLIDLTIMIMQEFILGAFLGLGVLVLMGGIQIAGHIAGQLSGMSLADVFNPGFDTEMPLFSHLLSLLMLCVYLLIGGHRLLIGALLQTFQAFPCGQIGDLSNLGPFLVELLSQSINLGIRTAAPVMTALILTNVLMGLVGKTLPQLNIMSLGFGLNTLITLGMMAISLTTVVWMFEEKYPDTLDSSLKQLVDTKESPPTSRMLTPAR